jgi:hypothetical protein
MDQVLWGEMLDVLKSISTYLVKQDATQERAKIQKPPKISENQADMEISGGDDPAGKPGSGVAKSLRKAQDGGTLEIPIDGTRTKNPNVGIDSEGKTKIENEWEDEEEGLDRYGGFGEKEEGLGEEEEELGEEEENLGREEEEEEGDKFEDSYGDVAELKSLLKDIRSSLIANSRGKALPEQFSKSLAAELKKSIQPMIKQETQRMMRKMGFRPSTPDVTRFGVEDDGTFNGAVNIKKSADKDVNDLAKTIDDLSNMSWQKLGQMRERTGQFNPFNR